MHAFNDADHLLDNLEAGLGLDQPLGVKESMRSLIGNPEAQQPNLRTTRSISKLLSTQSNNQTP